MGLVSQDHNDWHRAATFRLIESRAEREANWFAKDSPKIAQNPQNLQKSDADEAGEKEEEEGGEGVEDFLGFVAQEGGGGVAIELRQDLKLEQACSQLPFTFCTATCSQVCVGVLVSVSIFVSVTISVSVCQCRCLCRFCVGYLLVALVLAVAVPL